MKQGRQQKVREGGRVRKTEPSEKNVREEGGRVRKNVQTLGFLDSFTYIFFLPLGFQGPQITTIKVHS